MKKIILAMLFASFALLANDNLVNTKSTHTVQETINKFEKIVISKGMTVFTKIDHAKGATSVDMKLRPTQLLIFGNPKIGTLLMQSNQTIGLELPIRVLFWEDKDGASWVTYNKPMNVANGHAITDKEKVVNKMTKALGMFTKKATN